MPPLDPQLVREITEQVVRALKAQQSGGAAGGGSRGRVPADTRPPVGVCTGDYSQFTDRPDLTPGGDGPAPDPAPDPRPQAPALTGIITADRLRRAIADAKGGPARLAPDAKLTPLANDFAREHPELIERVSVDSIDNRQSAIGNAPWLWWADGHCPSVLELANGLRSRLRPSAAPRSDAGLVQVVKRLAVGVDRGDLAGGGGVLFVRHAARATCLANRCRGLRAAVGTCEEAVDQAVRDLGINTLIIEYPYTRPPAMQAMVRRVLSTTPKAPPHLQRQLDELV